MGYSVPEVESAPAFFLRTYPQAYPQAGQGCGKLVRPQERRPPIAELCRLGPYTPQQNIFAKVKAAIVALTCGYIYCDEGHIRKTRNGLNFLPYI